MKKVMALTSSIIMIIFAFCSCNSVEEPTQEETASETQTVTEVTESAVSETSVAKTDNNNIYADTLDKIYNIVLGGARDDVSVLDDEAHEDMMGISETAFYGNHLSDIGYLIKDLNGDDVPELIIAVDGEQNEYNPGMRVLNVFGYKDNAVNVILEGWYRNAYYMLENNEFYFTGSGGAAYHCAGIYSINSSGEIACKNLYFTYDAEGGSVIKYYSNPNDVSDPEDAATTEITEEEFNAFIDEYTAKEISPDITPISDWGIPEVNVQYFGEAETEPADYEEYTVDDGEYASKLLFSSDEEIKNFRLLSLSLTGVNDDGDPTYDISPIKEYDSLSESLAVTLVFYGDTPNYGFSVTDKFGNEIIFTISQSGEDGSLVTDIYVEKATD